MTKSEFAKYRHEKDELKIEVLKAGAVRALSNYMLYESGRKDKKLEKAMNRFFNPDSIASVTSNTSNPAHNTTAMLSSKHDSVKVE
jgi:hypothetical protein